MKLQHTSGAVIEDARLEEREGYFSTPTGATYGNIYSKSDWLKRALKDVRKELKKWPTWKRTTWHAK